MRAARRFLERLEREDKLDPTARVLAELYGSLALTGKGHGTDRAVLLGLSGETPEGIDPDGIAPTVARVRAEQTLNLYGQRRIPFIESRDLLFHREESLPMHPNGMRFTAFDAAGAVIESRIYYSVGGGFVVNEESAGQDRLVRDEHEVPYHFRSGADLLRMSAESGLPIWELMLANERVWRSDEEIRAGVLKIWAAMRACVEGAVERGASGGFRCRGARPTCTGA